MVELWATVLISGCFAGLVAILATVAIERLGGIVGGVLATLPTTIIPASIGLAVQMEGDPGALRRAMFAVPLGMLVDDVFLLHWRFVPRLLPSSWSLYGRLGIVTGTSLVLWAVLGTVVWQIQKAIEDERGIEALGALAFLCTISAGLVLTCCFHVEAPRGSNHVKWKVLLARGAFASLSIMAAVGIGAQDPGIGGVLATFPAIFLTTMVAVSLAQGEAVSVGAIGPMILSSSAVPAFAMLFSVLTIYMSIPLAAFLAWIIGVCITSIPIAFLLRWQERRRQEQAFRPLEEQEDEDQDALFSTDISDLEMAGLQAGGVLPVESDSPVGTSNFQALRTPEK